MANGKSNSRQKTREPYGKVTEVGQVPIALQEIHELARSSKLTDSFDVIHDNLARIETMADSIIAVTCANPGCISEMAANSAHVTAHVAV